MERKIESYIDHTVLKAEATSEDVKKICSEAIEYKFASVCVNPIYVELSASELAGTSIDICTVVGFPLGATPTEVKVFETKKAVSDGATEIDMVISVGKLKDGENEYVQNDIAAVVDAAGEAIVKVIIENCYLTEEEKKRACLLSEKAGAAFVKTSTGFGPSGATVEDVKLMAETVPSLQVKAAGGIRDWSKAKSMIDNGADRIGASSSVNIIKEAGE